MSPEQSHQPRQYEAMPDEQLLQLWRDENDAQAADALRRRYRPRFTEIMTSFRLEDLDEDLIEAFWMQRASGLAQELSKSAKPSQANPPPAPPGDLILDAFTSFVNDAGAVDQYRKGDERGLTELMARYDPLIRSILRRSYTGGPSGPREVDERTADFWSFMTCPRERGQRVGMSRLQDYDFQRGTFSAFLSTCCRNFVKDLNRKSSRPDAIAGPLVPVETKPIDLAALRDLLGQLPSNQHAVVVLYFLYQMVLCEIANIFGVDTSTIYRWKQQAIERLREG